MKKHRATCPASNTQHVAYPTGGAKVVFAHTVLDKLEVEAHTWRLT
jgi:hypothetical protein